MHSTLLAKKAVLGGWSNVRNIKYPFPTIAQAALILVREIAHCQISPAEKSCPEPIRFQDIIIIIEFIAVLSVGVQLWDNIRTSRMNNT